MSYAAMNAFSSIGRLITQARGAQAIANTYDQARVNELVAAAGWALLEPQRNRSLAELAVTDSGSGHPDDKAQAAHRQILGLLRDLQEAKSVDVIAEHPAAGITEIARPVGIVCAIVSSSNPASAHAHHILCALKGRNAIIILPQPWAWRTCQMLLDYLHAQLDQVGAPRDLVQIFPQTSGTLAIQELMRQCDLLLTSGVPSHVRAAAISGTPVFSAGSGNVACIVDESADIKAAAERIMHSKAFDHASDGSSESSLVVVDTVYELLMTALQARGAVLLTSAQKAVLQSVMWSAGHLSPGVVGQSASALLHNCAANSAQVHREFWTRLAATQPHVLLVEEDGFGPAHPFSGEKGCPVLACYRVPDFERATNTVERIYAYQGAGHSVGLHSLLPERALQLGLRLPVARVIVNQSHGLAAGGSFGNGLPFSMSLGCGSWGKNSFSDNLTYRHCLNITRIAQPIPEQMPAMREIFAAYFASHGEQ